MSGLLFLETGQKQAVNTGNAKSFDLAKGRVPDPAAVGFNPNKVNRIQCDCHHIKSIPTSLNSGFSCQSSSMMNEDQMIGETEFDLTDVSYRRRDSDRPQPLDYPTRETVDKFIENQKQPQSTAQSFLRKIFRLR